MVKIFLKPLGKLVSGGQYFRSPHNSKVKSQPLCRDQKHSVSNAPVTLFPAQTHCFGGLYTFESVCRRTTTLGSGNYMIVDQVHPQIAAFDSKKGTPYCQHLSTLGPTPEHLTFDVHIASGTSHHTKRTCWIAQ